MNEQGFVRCWVVFGHQTEGVAAEKLASGTFPSGNSAGGTPHGWSQHVSRPPCKATKSSPCQPAALTHIFLPARVEMARESPRAAKTGEGGGRGAPPARRGRGAVQRIGPPRGRRCRWPATRRRRCPPHRPPPEILLRPPPRGLPYPTGGGGSGGRFWGSLLTSKFFFKKAPKKLWRFGLKILQKKMAEPPASGGVPTRPLGYPPLGGGSGRPTRRV